MLAHADREEFLDDNPPHIIAGDFNTTSWYTLFMDWLQDDGINELVDPNKPTFALGSSIDKFLFIPGYYIPSTFSPSGMPDVPCSDFSEDPPLYPASVADRRYLSDHCPILLRVPCDHEEIPEHLYRCFRTEGLTEEEWL